MHDLHHSSAIYEKGVFLYGLKYHASDASHVSPGNRGSRLQCDTDTLRH